MALGDGGRPPRHAEGVTDDALEWLPDGEDNSVGHEPGGLSRMSSGHRPKLSEDEFRFVRDVLRSSPEEEDREVADVLGRRHLTDDERERVRRLLVHKMLEAGLLPDGSPGREGRAIDDIIGKLTFY